MIYPLRVPVLPHIVISSPFFFYGLSTPIRVYLDCPERWSSLVDTECLRLRYQIAYQRLTLFLLTLWDACARKTPGGKATKSAEIAPRRHTLTSTYSLAIFTVDDYTSLPDVVSRTPRVSLLRWLG